MAMVSRERTFGRSGATRAEGWRGRAPLFHMAALSRALNQRVAGETHVIIPAFSALELHAKYTLFCEGWRQCGSWITC
ncbi:MAG TPA: hypothetical protein VF534_32190 [Paraburkholderia sp.]